MVAPARFPDWSSLPAGEREAAIGRARLRLKTIGRKLNATAQEIDSGFDAAGPLSGMPYVAKDMIATGVTPPSCGCAAPLEPLGKPAAIIERLRRAGGCLIGTAEMTELAYEPSGINSVRGNVLNPWNKDFVPGGSSSGSAALVASGCAFAALGSDTGGSVRIPAHCCGVTGLKPTWGVLPLDGAMPLSPSLDTIGIFARGAADLAMVWTALFGEVAAPSAHSAIVLEDAFGESDAEVTQLCRDAIARFGLPVAGRGGFPKEADERVLLVMQGEAARAHRNRLDDVRVDATLRKRLAKGLSIDDDALAQLVAGREAARQHFLETFLGEAAVAFMPVMPIRTPRVAETDPTSPDFKARTLYAMSRFTRFVNYLGLPALALPVGFDSRGMPVGLQIVGRPDSEPLLIALATSFQMRTDWHGRIPAAIASDIAAEKGLAA